MTIYGRLLLAGAGSALLLIGALGFQYLGGLAPCPMCIWQRWPHLAAALIAALAVTLLWRQRKGLAALGGLTMLGSAALGAYHAGVERGWWPGPGTCSAGPVDGMGTQALLQQILTAPLVRCDEIVWSFLGLSMAGWNAIVSAGLAALWLASAYYESSSASQ